MINIIKVLYLIDSWFDEVIAMKEFRYTISLQKY